MKRIVMIRSNPVDPDSRVEKEAWSLTKEGFDVHILAWDRSEDYVEKNDFIDVLNVKIPITRFGHKAQFGAGMKSLIPYLAFQLSVHKWLKKHKNEYDAVHACDFDTAYFSYRFLLSWKKIFVFDIFDMLFPEPTSFLGRIVNLAEKNIVNKANATIICSEGRRKQLLGSRPKKLVVIHNTPIAEMLPDTTCACINEKYKVAYVGILQEDRMLCELLDYFKGHSNIELYAGGFGRLENAFIQASKNYENIFFFGKIPYKQTLELENHCDIMLAIYDPRVANNRNAAPNNFYEGLMLGKPLIMAKGTGMSEIVENNRLGAVIDYSEKGLEEGISELIARNNEWPEISSKMKAIYKKEYAWDIMERRLSNLYRELFE